MCSPTDPESPIKGGSLIEKQDKKYSVAMSGVTHSHAGGHSHSHDDHGHSHEILDGPGSFRGREMPIAEGRNWEERTFTVGIGG